MRGLVYSYILAIRYYVTDTFSAHPNFQKDQHWRILYVKVSSRDYLYIYARMPENVTNIWNLPILSHSRRIDIWAVLPLLKHLKNDTYITVLTFQKALSTAFQNCQCPSVNGNGSDLYTQPYLDLPLISWLVMSKISVRIDIISKILKNAQIHIFHK